MNSYVMLKGAAKALSTGGISLTGESLWFAADPDDLGFTFVTMSREVLQWLLVFPLDSVLCLNWYIFLLDVKKITVRTVVSVHFLCTLFALYRRL